VFDIMSDVMTCAVQSLSERSGVHLLQPDFSCPPAIVTRSVVNITKQSQLQYM